jgi:hypothetical protein
LARNHPQAELDSGGGTVENVKFNPGQLNTDENDSDDNDKYFDQDSDSDEDMIQGGSQPQTTRWTKHMRQFGVVAYILIQPKASVTKIGPKYRKSVFLGYSERNSCWLFGAFVHDKRLTSNKLTRWAQFETKSAKFTKIKLKSLDMLKNSGGTWADGVDLDVTIDELPILTWGDPDAQERPAINIADEGEIPFENTNNTENAEMNTARTTPPKKSLPKIPPTPQTPIVKKRGRPVGSKDEIKRKTRRDKGKRRREDAKFGVFEGQRSDDEDMCSFVAEDAVVLHAKLTALYDLNIIQNQSTDGLAQASVAVQPTEYAGGHHQPKVPVVETLILGDLTQDDPYVVYADEQNKGVFDLIIPKNEKFDSCRAYLSVQSALKTPDAPRWLEAINREKLKLIAAETWRELTHSESQTYKDVIPIVVLLTKKRDGTFKARACVLGNRIDKVGMSLYTPVVSMVAHRLMLVSAARQGDSIRCFDIDCAFLNAKIDDCVYVSIPKEWRENNEPAVKRLNKALYGLPQAPLLWFKKYLNDLQKLGWFPCPQEKGLWRMPSEYKKGTFLKLSVYVDDNVITGQEDAEVLFQTNRILQIFTGRMIEPERRGKWQIWDILGAEFSFCREERSMQLSMGTYISKVAAAYNIHSFSSNPNCVTELDLEDDGDVIDFPYREIIGSLQWCATVARPDISRQANLLSRYNSRPPTTHRAGAAVKILKYLNKTKEKGITYSPASEKAFKLEYTVDGQGNTVKTSALNLFTDASFASKVDQYYSVCGMLLILHGTPIAWKSVKQTVRAESTCEAEWISASEGLKWVRSMGFLPFFTNDYNSEQQLPDSLRCWIDSLSALAITKSDQVQPRSHHYALRLHRVRDNGHRYSFCTTDKMRADGLTKAVNHKQRAMLLGTPLPDDSSEIAESNFVYNYFVCGGCFICSP